MQKVQEPRSTNYRKAEFLLSLPVHRSLVPTFEVCRLKCELCKRYLSCSPLRVLPTGKTICGRCGKPPGSLQVLLLEELFHRKRFPCIFDKNGCTETVMFDQLDVHERYCRFRQLKCPMAQTLHCNKILIVTDVVDHLWVEHNGYIYGNSVTFQINITRSGQHKFIILMNNRFFENVLTICVERGRIRHDVLKDNFPYDRNNYRFHAEEILSDNTTRPFTASIGTLPVNSEDMYVSVTGVATTEVDDTLAQRSPCVRCTYLTRHYYKDDEKKGWICFICAKPKRPCSNFIWGCNHRDRDQNLNKHYQFFCEFTGFCMICKKLMDDTNILDHYTDEHSDIMLPEGKMFTLRANSQKDGWFIINALFGKVLCRFMISENSMIITLYTSLRSNELHNHNCRILLNNTNLEVCNFNFTSEPPVQYNAIYDWQIQLTGAQFKNVFQKGECSVIINFMKRMPIGVIEWLNDSFKRVSDMQTTIVLN